MIVCSKLLQSATIFHFSKENKTYIVHSFVSHFCTSKSKYLVVEIARITLISFPFLNCFNPSEMELLNDYLKLKVF